MRFSWHTGILTTFFLFFIILYFWNLGGFSLASWDEAWFGAISKNLAGQRNWLILSFNGEPHFEHPPFGFWLQAFSQKIFGINEFAVRLPSVIWGLAALFFIYQIGKSWGGSLAGLISMIVLGTCIWFVLRVRSGNLDTIFIGNMLGSLYWALRAKTKPSYLSFMFLFILIAVLTKSALGFGLPLLCFYWLLPLKKSTSTRFFLGLGSILAILFIWSFTVQYFSAINPLAKMIAVGTRRGWANLWDWQYIQNNLFYLHMGVEEWYYPIILALILSLFFLKSKEIKLLWLWLIIYFIPFLPNRKTELWHLLPAYPAQALLLGLVITRLKFLKIPLFLFIVVIFIRQNQRLINIIKEQRGASPEAVLATATQGLPGDFYFDGDDIPVSVYYSDHKVYAIKYNPPPFNKVDYVLNYGKEGTIIITQSENLPRIKREWQQIKKIGDKSLIVLGEIH